MGRELGKIKIHFMKKHFSIKRRGKNTCLALVGTLVHLGKGTVGWPIDSVIVKYLEYTIMRVNS